MVPKSDDYMENFGLDEKRIRAKPTRIDAWKLGNRYARQEKAKWLDLVTVDTLAEVMPRLKKYGFCILNRMKDLFPSQCQPDAHQRDYISKVPQADLFTLFEGAIWSDIKSGVELYWPKDTKIGQRVQLKTQGHSGKWGPIYVEYKKKYRPQLETIIRGMFPTNDVAGNPENWKLDFNSIVGGIGYQHPHSDIGKAGAFKHLDIFPFVGLHGFGVNEFALWLLPPNIDYGFFTRSNRIKFCSCAGTKPMLESPPILLEDIWSFYLCPQQDTKSAIPSGAELVTHRRLSHTKTLTDFLLGIQT